MYGRLITTDDFVFCQQILLRYIILYGTRALHLITGAFEKIMQFMLNAATTNFSLEHYIIMLLPITAYT